jgi:predicted O-linked N-acetylglucosamine transferase (SPINDLY family)
MEFDPEAAFQYASTRGADSAQLEQYALKAAITFSRWNLAEALEWSRTLPEAALQPVALSAVALAQGYDESEPATDWMSALAPGPTRDRVVYSYVTGFLAHAGGASTPDTTLLDNQPETVSDVANAIQQSKLDARQKDRLTALVYGWK